ncbi:rhodanese homology domain-containing protein [Pantoea cypripedii]|uniref:Sulfurtransferase n=1 Tax=Pantoea cypripedii TaxID=55209 RepID=A0A1X1EWT0_PANCY|nr:rhodanese homology domain-containing protein [Pantoea cypripedii]MBP2198594.1 rhodanese-related sulfurtransferase [Pantoea cypripedii]ORM94381.1 sulfurtransferase [Pantoea cypripedii]
MTKPIFPLRQVADIVAALRQQQEVALVDVRDEALYATGHPLFAVNIPLSKLELEWLDRIPRRETVITLYDNGEGLAQTAAERISALGYHNVALLAGDLQGWQDAGGELFIDVNSPSKAFGELVEHHNQTPSLAADEVHALLASGNDVVVLDARRFDEFQTMSIPGATSVPGGELVLRVRDLAPSPNTTVIVNCAGRTRSIIGTQSLVNAGIRNPVYALRNGTIGWTLAGHPLETGQTRRYETTSETAQRQAAAKARQLADQAGVARIHLSALADLQQENRTSYLFDVRDAQEYAAGHLPGSRHVPGGQLVQETDHYASVRGARIVLIDDDNVRANMTASWLAQLGWQVSVLDGLQPSDFSASGPWQAQVPPVAHPEFVSPEQLASWLDEGQTQVLDFTTRANHLNSHIPGAAWLLRSTLQQQGKALLPEARRYVLTCGSSLLAGYAVEQVAELTGKPVYVLAGGNAAWRAAGLPTEQGAQQLLSPSIDRYRRPYEGTDIAPAVMQAYLDWEYGLVAQLDRDGTHGFRVLKPLAQGQ